MELSLKNIFLLVTIFPTLIYAYPNGKVEAACSTMIPGHPHSAQTSFAPYSLTLTSTNYTGMLVFLVTLSKEQTGSDFKGFMIQARAPRGDTSLGTFVVNSSDIQTLTCTSSQSAVSHTSRNLKSSVQAIWIPPKAKSDIQFRATVVTSFDTFWTNVLSDILPLDSAGSQLMIPTVFQLLVCSSTLIYALLLK
ncbi:putative ferric-chelate reductase 1 [Rana temporaria]|uniref:putative ferric-chelate reductase 1 n=1 Tax=Rana temporaria TaxID=8407 RepID=UPI001AADE2D8|nr:putative ferric-chelate reductase 1 [Rana temporaria]